MIPKKGYKKAAVQRTTAKGQYGAAGSATSEASVTPVEDSYKGKGPIPLSANSRQAAAPFLFVESDVTCADLRAVGVRSQYHEKQFPLRS